MNLALLVVVQRALSEAEPGPRRAELFAAVHGWYEGHIAAELGGRPEDALPKGPPHEMPDPPWPADDEPELATVLRQVDELFEGSDKEGRVFAAAALGWAAGRRAAARCEGCLTQGISLGPLAAELRSGNLRVWFQAKPSSSEAAGP
jgi:hypothetical protein